MIGTEPGFAEEADERAAALAATRPVNAKCPTCEHEWPVLYLPMLMEKAARLMMDAKCPKGCTAGPRLGSLV